VGSIKVNSLLKNEFRHSNVDLEHEDLKNLYITEMEKSKFFLQRKLIKQIKA